jgi:1,4-dihydroxy-6-naphthoate synthase
MPELLRLGISPCPNDTYIFYALVHGRVGAEDVRFQTSLADVQELNEAALEGRFDMVKVSAAVYARLKKDYVLLRSGGALGWGCGPVLVARQDLDLADLAGAEVAVPGLMTTAARLLRLHGLHKGRLKVKRYDEIMPAVSAGEVPAGLVIHEGRFTYQRYGLKKLLDLGSWWEETTGKPLPLGCILARKELGRDMHRRLEVAIRASIDYARHHPQEAWPYIRRLAQEMDEATILEHIDTFVTEHSYDLGAEGLLALERLAGEDQEDSEADNLRK